MSEYYKNNKFQIMYVNNLNIAVLITLIISIGLFFVTPYSLTATAVALGFLIFRIVKANIDFPKRRNKALEDLNNCMNELADFKQFYEDNKQKKIKLLSSVEYL